MSNGNISEDDRQTALSQTEIDPHAVAAMERFLGIVGGGESETSAAASSNQGETLGPGENAPLHAVKPPPGYEIIGELGRGGMGVVYKARQLQLNRIVALKMILGGGHAGKGERVRFLAEAAAVAGLQHPHIVSLLEFGEHEGEPFFTLEYMPGGSLASRLHGLPQPGPQAARLIEQLARGIHYAHAHGIVHRDLKPANVLIGEDGTPKITDFGLARRGELGTGLTATGDVLGTPSYMAPEQAGGETKHAGPAADVYALGAILYECLTGQPPFRAATTVETVLQVVGQEPVSIRQLQPQTSVDLVTICHKCLQKEPHKRYGSASELADDLRRFQVGEPILARPVGWLERSWRWCRRHPAIAVVSAAALLFLVGGLIGMTLLYFQAEGHYARAELQRTAAENATELANKERDSARAYAAEADRQKQEADRQKHEADRQSDKAREQASRARQVSKIMAGMFEASDPLGFNGVTFGLNNRAGQTMKARDLLDQGLKLTRDDADLAPLIKADVYLQIGNVYRSIGLHKDAEPLLTKSLALRQTAAAPPAEIAISLHALGWLYHERGNYPRAEALYRDALAHFAKDPQSDPRAVLNTQFNLAWLFSELDELEQAEELALTVLNKRRELLGEDHRDTVLARFALSAMYLARHEPLSAFPLLTQNLASLEKLGIDRNILNAGAQFQQAVIDAHLFGKRKAAEETMRRCIDSTRAAIGPRHIYMAFPLTQLGIFLHERGENAEALKYYGDALDVVRDAVGMTHPKLLLLVEHMAHAHRQIGQPALATPLFEEFLSAQREHYGADHVFVADTMLAQSHHELACGKSDKQRELLEAAAKIYRAALAGRPPRRSGECLNLLGTNAFRREKYALAESLYREALAVSRRQHKKAHPETTIIMLNLVTTQLRMKNYASDGMSLLEEIEAMLPALPASQRRDHTLLWTAASASLFLEAKGDHQKAAALLSRHSPATNAQAQWVQWAQHYVSCLDKLAEDPEIMEETREDLREKYGRAAVDSLRRAWKAAPGSRPAWLQSEWAALRERSDFRRLTTDIENALTKKKGKP